MFTKITQWPRKMAIYWMSAEEHQNQELMNSLRPQFRKWKEQKYQPIVFISGEGDLEENMYWLMKRNYQELAEKMDNIQ